MNKLKDLKVSLIVFIFFIISCNNSSKNKIETSEYDTLRNESDIKLKYDTLEIKKVLNSKLPKFKGDWSLCIENYSGIQCCDMLFINNLDDTIFINLKKSNFWIDCKKKYKLHISFIDPEVLPNDTMAISLRYSEYENNREIRNLVEDTSKMMANINYRYKNKTYKINKFNFMRANDFKIYTLEEYNNKIKQMEEEN